MVTRSDWRNAGDLIDILEKNDQVGVAVSRARKSSCQHFVYHFLNVQFVPTELRSMADRWEIKKAQMEQERRGKNAPPCLWYT